MIGLLAGLSSCSNVCQEPHSINFNQTGKCIDLSSNVTGRYSGTLRDSTSSSGTSYQVVLSVSKLNNSNVSVSLVSPTTAPFTAFTALVLQSNNGYYLSVISDSAAMLTGGAAAYNSQADGVYFSSNGQLSLYVETNTQAGNFESFTGLRQ